MKKNTTSKANSTDSNPSEETKPVSNGPLLKLRNLLLSSYAKFVLKKAVFYLVVVFFSVSLVFIIIEAMPGDPVAVMLSSGNPPPGADLDALADIMREYFGLDRPILERYFVYLGNFYPFVEYFIIFIGKSDHKSSSCFRLHSI